MGVSPHNYHLELKILRAKEMILTTDKSIKEISFELGFQSIHYFSRLFKNKIGMSPVALRK
jgi:AraC-like DNA-binding protein